jgi:uncharacterized protein (TIGR03067 family)
MRPLVALLLLTGFAPAAPVPKAVKAKANDAELLLGYWKPVGDRAEGFEFAPDGVMKAHGSRERQGDGVPYKWSIDPTASPKRMSWGGSTDGKPQWECVYELDGDRLRLSYAPAGGAVPAVVGLGNGVFYCDLVRDTPAK